MSPRRSPRISPAWTARGGKSSLAGALAHTQAGQGSRERPNCRPRGDHGDAGHVGNAQAPGRAVARADPACDRARQPARARPPARTAARTAVPGRAGRRGRGDGRATLRSRDLPPRRRPDPALAGRPLCDLRQHVGAAAIQREARPDAGDGYASDGRDPRGAAGPAGHPGPRLHAALQLLRAPDVLPEGPRVQGRYTTVTRFKHAHVQAGFFFRIAAWGALSVRARGCHRPMDLQEPLQAQILRREDAGRYFGGADRDEEVADDPPSSGTHEDRDRRGPS